MDALWPVAHDYANSNSDDDDDEGDDFVNLAQKPVVDLSDSDELTTQEADPLQMERVQVMLKKLEGLPGYGNGTRLENVLLQPPCDVSQMLDASLDDVELLYRHISHTIVNSPDSTLLPISVEDQLSSSCFGVISTGHKCLDNVLAGGVKCGLVTEITGASGTGKTALALNLAGRAATLAREGRGNGKHHTLWISSNQHPFSTRATAGYLRSTLGTYRGDNNGSNAAEPDRFGGDAETALQQLAIVTIPTLGQLLEHMPVLRENIMLNDGVRLVVVDDFSAMVRRTFTGMDGEVIERHNAVAALMNAMKSVAQDLRVAVVIITQSEVDLGHAFLYAVNTRLRLSRCLLQPNDAAADVAGNVRLVHLLELVKSCMASDCKFECKFEGFYLGSVHLLTEGAVALRDVDFYGVDPFGYAVVPTFVHC